MKKRITALSCLSVALSLLTLPTKASCDKTDFTDLLKNPSFELTTGDQPLSVVPTRFLPYGWNHTVIYNGSTIPWSATANSTSKNITASGANLGNSYGVNADATNIDGAYVFWTKPNAPIDFFELYQELPVGTADGQLPPGDYTVSCRLAVMGNNNSDSRFTTQRLFAQTATHNNVQYFGRENNYGQNLTAGENNTYADWMSSNGSGSGVALCPMSVAIRVNAGETLRIGIKTGNKGKDGTKHTTGNNVGWFKADHFQLKQDNGFALAQEQVEAAPFTIESRSDGMALNLPDAVRAQVQVVSLFGRTVYSATVSGRTSIRLPQGLYIVRVTAGSIDRTVKVLVK
jgi:hypothetical protein